MASETEPGAGREDPPLGILYAVSAFLLWGFLPVYLKWASHIPPFEVVAHRIIWSVPIAAMVIIISGRRADLLAAIRSPRMLAMAAMTATFVTVNWSIYVWAVANEQAVDAALGYYINPLFNVFLGAVLLGERLSRLQILAVAIAFCAVAVLTWEAGRLPMVAVGLTLSWGAYAFCKKFLPIGPNQGFFLEVLILSLPALIYVFWLGGQTRGHFMAGEAADTWLLLGCGLVTAAPLIFYASGAKLLRLSTIGILGYIAPTLIFLVAVFLFGEPFDGARRVAFPMIWLAVVLYAVSLLGKDRHAAA